MTGAAMMMNRKTIFPLAIVFFGISLLAMVPGPSAQEGMAQAVVAQGDAPAAKAAESKQEAKLTPEERMRRRFPQPAKVGFLVGLPVLDYDDVTIGYVRHVVRTP